MLRLNPYEIAELAVFVQRIETGATYGIGELARLGADATVLACFCHIDAIPADNVLAVVCLMLGLDVWSGNHLWPKVSYLRVRALARIAELKGGAQ